MESPEQRIEPPHTDDTENAPGEGPPPEGGSFPPPATDGALAKRTDRAPDASSNRAGEKAAERAEQLARVALFSSLKPRALERIGAIAREELLPSGATLFQHGDVGDKLYLILDGKVRIARQIPGMGEEALAVLGPGEVFGEMALLDEAPRSADALCHESCRLLAISKEDLDDLLFQDKELAYEVLWGTVHLLVDRLRSTNDKLTLLGVSSRFS